MSFYFTTEGFAIANIREKNTVQFQSVKSQCVTYTFWLYLHLIRKSHIELLRGFLASVEKVLCLLETSLNISCGRAVK